MNEHSHHPSLVLEQQQVLARQRQTYALPVTPGATTPTRSAFPRGKPIVLVDPCHSLFYPCPAFFFHGTVSDHPDDMIIDVKEQRSPPSKVQHLNPILLNSLLSVRGSNADEQQHNYHDPNASRRSAGNPPPPPPPPLLYQQQNHPTYQQSSLLSQHRSGRPSGPSFDNDTTLSTYLYSLIHSLVAHAPSLSSTSASNSSSISSSSNTLPRPLFLRTAPDPSTIRFVSLCALWYLSSAVSSNTGKSILTRFRYPVTLTFVQFGFVSGYSLVFLVARERFGRRSGGVGGMARKGGSSANNMSSIMGGEWRWGVGKPSRKVFQGTVGMSLFQILGHIFGSMAIARVPVSTVHTIKVCTTDRCRCLAYLRLTLDPNCSRFLLSTGSIASLHRRVLRFPLPYPLLYINLSRAAASDAGCHAGMLF